MLYPFRPSKFAIAGLVLATGILTCGAQAAPILYEFTAGGNAFGDTFFGDSLTGTFFYDASAPVVDTGPGQFFSYGAVSNLTLSINGFPFGLVPSAFEFLSDGIYYTAESTFIAGTIFTAVPNLCQGSFADTYCDDSGGGGTAIYVEDMTLSFPIDPATPPDTLPPTLLPGGSIEFQPFCFGTEFPCPSQYALGTAGFGFVGGVEPITSVTQISEPASFALFAVALFGFGLLRWRPRSRRRGIRPLKCQRQATITLLVGRSALRAALRLDT